MLYISPNSLKKKQDERYQKRLCYKYSLLGYQAVSYKQKKERDSRKNIILT
jgi:hypothetical protein